MLLRGLVSTNTVDMFRLVPGFALQQIWCMICSSLVFEQYLFTAIDSDEIVGIMGMVGIFVAEIMLRSRIPT